MVITYRFATKEDNQQLLALTAVSGMEGDISLRIDRHPDFFRLLRMRGDSQVFVATEGHEIIGCVCVSHQQVYVGGQIMPLLYIGDFKVAETRRKKGIGQQLCNVLGEYAISSGGDLAFLNVSKGNKKPLSFFKNRSHVPDFENIGVFRVYQFFGKRKAKQQNHYTIESSQVTTEFIQFLNAHYAHYELGPVITEDMLKDTSIYVVYDKHKIIAAMCLMDTMHAKQNVVTKLSMKKKIMVSSVNIIHKMSGFSKMPGVHQPINMVYIKYLALLNPDKHLVHAIINHARSIVFEKSFSFVSFGIHEKDPLNACLTGLRNLTFESVGMLISLKNTGKLIEQVKKGIPFEDYSLV